MADYCSDGVWKHGGGMMSLDGLPVSLPLKDAINAWLFWFHHDENTSRPLGRLAFSDMGRYLAHSIKRELPDWTVVYFDEAKRDLANHDQPRIEFEYEIEV